MRVARILVSAPSSSAACDVAEAGRARIAIVRDDAIYDVAALEHAFAVTIDRGDPSDFQTRVATLRCTGLYDLDARLFRSERPSSARVPNDCAMLLAPCDTDRASLFHVDARLVVRGARAACRIGQARSLLGQDALVGVRDTGALEIEVSLAVVIGDDLASADPRQANAAIMGYAIFVDWIAEGAPNEGLATVRGISSALGPTLVSRYTLLKLADACATIRVGDETIVSGRVGEMPISIADAVGIASRELDLRSGDVVAVGPLPRAAGIRVGLHEPVEVGVDGLGTLRGVAVPRR